MLLLLLTALACTDDADAVLVTPALPPGSLLLEVREDSQVWVDGVMASQSVEERRYRWDVEAGGRLGQAPLQLEITLEHVRLEEWRDGAQVSDHSSDGPPPEQDRYKAELAPAGLQWSLSINPEGQPAVRVDRSPLDARLAQLGVDTIRARGVRLRWSPEELVELARSQLLSLPSGAHAPGAPWRSPPGPGQSPLGAFGHPDGVLWTIDSAADGVILLSGDYAFPSSEEVRDARCSFTYQLRDDGLPQELRARCEASPQLRPRSVVDEVVFTYAPG